MAALLTLAQMREHVETDLVDAAMQRLIDGADAEIVSRFGEHVTQDDTLDGEVEFIYPTRAVTGTPTITEIDDNDIFNGDPVETLLVAADFKIRQNGRQIERLNSGPNPRQVWTSRVNITYVPKADTEKRILATINLVRHEVVYNVQISEGIGDQKTTQREYNKEKQAILETLAAGQTRFA